MLSKDEEFIFALFGSTFKVTKEAVNLMSKTTPEIEKTTLLVKEINAANLEQNFEADQINNAI